MKTIIALSLFSLGQIGICHEGHGIPGALPPAPHGGVVQEAVDVEEHAHDEHGHKDEHEQDGHGSNEKKHAHVEGKEETELFFEVTYKDKEIAVYPLALQSEKKNTFTLLPVKGVLSKIELKAEFPRAKKFEPLSPKIADDSIKVAFDSKNANRFIVHVKVEFEKEMKLAKVQIERK